MIYAVETAHNSVNRSVKLKAAHIAFNKQHITDPLCSDTIVSHGKHFLRNIEGGHVVASACKLQRHASRSTPHIENRAYILIGIFFKAFLDKGCPCGIIDRFVQSVIHRCKNGITVCHIIRHTLYLRS